MAMAISHDVITSSYVFVFPFIACFITAISFHFFLKKPLAGDGGHGPPLPPSPPALPIIGHLHLIGPILSESFRELSLRHGPLMRLRMGASNLVVVSNAAVAREIFQTLDLSFCSRPEFGATEYFIYRGSRFITAPYGDNWRFLKKLCVTRLLGVSQLEKNTDVRAEEVARLVDSIGELARGGRAADLGRELTSYTNNVICRMAMSCRCSGSENEADKMKELVRTCLILGGKLSIGDVLGPWLRKLDFSGNGKKLTSTLTKYNDLIEKIIEEHEKNAADGLKEEPKKDLMDILLETHKDPSAEVKISRNDLKSFLLDLLLAGTETTSTAMQWAMAELINNPGIFKKLRDEIVSTVGIDRLVYESDLPKLPYLRAVVRETLRLHTSAPLVLRECREDCSVNGYLVRAGTRVLINTPAIMRDPGEWKDPEVFIPERFLEGPGSEGIPTEYRRQNFRYVPFGSGRRTCVGETMAMLVMQVTIGSLIQCFDWTVKGAMDLRQGPGFSAGMATSLVCYPVVHVDPAKACKKVLINASAIMRDDPGEWKDPDKFILERFLEGSPDPEGFLEHQRKFKGQNFRYVPFGSRRRGCVGETMVMLVMHVAGGSLIQCFDWKVKGRPSRALPRRTPLEACGE